jgi:hypothetical protein
VSDRKLLDEFDTFIVIVNVLSVVIGFVLKNCTVGHINLFILAANNIVVGANVCENIVALL